MRLKSVFLSLLFFLILNFHGQSLPLRFQGHVSEERNSLSGVTLQVAKGGRVINNILTDAGGKYAFELPMGGEYMVTVSKEGYVSKKFSVSTLGVPAEMTGVRFPSIEASLTLFKKLESIDYSLLSQPVNKFYFDVEREDFVFDENHLKEMKKGIERIKEQEKALLAKEKELEERYQTALKAADKLFSKRDWQGALTGYNQALSVKPEEAYPKEQLEKVNQALLEEKSKQEAAEANAAKALADKQAKEKAEAEALAKKQADELAAKKAAEAAAAAALASKVAKEKADAEVAKALADKQAKEKAEADAIAKKQADELAAKKAAEVAAAAALASKVAKEKADAEAAKALADKQAKEKAEADAIAKKQADELAAKKAAEVAAAAALASKVAKEKADAEAAKALADKQAKEKAEADAIAKKQADELAAKKASEAAAAAALANKLAKEKADAEAAQKAKAELEKQEKEKAAKAKAEADALAKRQADELAAKKAADEAAAKAKSQKTTTPAPTPAEVKYTAAIKKADEAFSKRRFYDAKAGYEEALMAKGGDAYAKSRLIECERQINADANQKVDERQKELLAKYQPGITEEIIPGENLVIIRRIVVKDNKAFVYEKKEFNWGGVACFRDGESITVLTFEQETKKQ